MRTRNEGPHEAMEETEQKLLPAPARGVVVALVLTAGAAATFGAAVGSGWLATGHGARHVHAAAASAPSPIQLVWRLFLAVGVIAVLAWLCGVAARRVGQPAVLGEIIAGVVLGPSVLRSLAPTLFHTLLPSVVMPDLNLLAQAGLVIFMFAVGLEVDRGMLRRHGKVIGAAGQATMVVPFVLGVLAAVPLYSTFGGHSGTSRDGIGLAPYAIFVGTALSVTAFPVLARLVEECGLRGTRLGSLAMMCAAVCDVLSWCALAIVLALTRAQGPLTVVRTLALTAALSVVVLVVARPLLQIIADRHAARARGPVRLLLVVGLIIGLAALTDKIGVHDIFGGFLAGLAMPRGNPEIDPVVQRLDGLNRCILLPVFFVSIGLQVNIWRAAAAPGVLAGGALLLLVAVAGKFGGTALVALGGGMPRKSSLGLATLMNTRGVTDIVVISIGFSIGVINADAFTVLVLMALITTMMAAPVLRRLGFGAKREPVPVAPAPIGVPVGG
jgi:Kef-type K+ transport system membrane component KefB